MTRRIQWWQCNGLHCRTGHSQVSGKLHVNFNMYNLVKRDFNRKRIAFDFSLLLSLYFWRNKTVAYLILSPLLVCTEQHLQYLCRRVKQCFCPSPIIQCFETYLKSGLSLKLQLDLIIIGNVIILGWNRQLNNCCRIPLTSSTWTGTGWPCRKI